METRYQVRNEGVASETARQAADALAAALRLHRMSVSEVLVVLDDAPRIDETRTDATTRAKAGAGGCAGKAATVRVDFLSGGRLIIEDGGKGSEDWSHIIPRIAARAADGVRRELERRWERATAG